MLVELIAIDVDSHKFGFSELEKYSVLLDRSIFEILQKEIDSRVTIQKISENNKLNIFYQNYEICGE